MPGLLSQNGSETSWQVPDFSIDLEHRDHRSTLVGQANIASSKGDWQLEFRAAQQTRRNSLAITALIQNLVPSGIAGNFSSLGVLKALDMVVNGETTIELSNSGKFVSGEVKLDLETGQITPPWDPDSPLRIDRGKILVRYLKAEDLVELEPSTLIWGQSKATFSGTFRPVRNAAGAPTSWDFAIKADEAVLAVEEAGLSPMKVDDARRPAALCRTRDASPFRAWAFAPATRRSHSPVRSSTHPARRKCIWPAKQAQCRSTYSSASGRNSWLARRGAGCWSGSPAVKCREASSRSILVPGTSPGSQPVRTSRRTR